MHTTAVGRWLSAVVFGWATVGLAAQGAATEEPQPLAPTWEGRLDVGRGAQLRLVLHLTRSGDDRFRATLDSLDQGAMALPVDTVQLEDHKLHLELTRLGAEYDATVNAARNELNGQWRQGGVSLPLRFVPVAAVETPRRPQEPKAPFPYQATDVTFLSRARDVTLAGTLTLPPGGTKLPAVVLITGSGRQDRDETVFGHRPFLVLADHLARHGIAALRFDDRGVGGSSRGPQGVTSRDFVADALGAVDFLRRQSAVDPRKIGLLGHSEGSLIAAMAAASSPDVGFIVMLAGPGLPGGQVLQFQTEAVARTSGASPAQIAAALAANRRIYAAVQEEKDDIAATARIRQVLAEAGLADEARDAQIKTVLSPWFRFFLGYDPRVDLAKIRVPVLSLIGEKDVQTVAQPNLDAIRGALESSGHRDHTVVGLPGLNHLFQECQTGAVSEYASIEQTMSPRAFGMIADWVLARFRAATR